MPNSVHEVFGFRNFANPAAIDLYLTSTTSGDIVEAIYLERYESGADR
jgi:hypothetical protein